MENSKNYHDEQNNLNTIKMRQVVSTLPSFCKQFFRGIQEYTSSRTRLAYAYDLRVFFEFIHINNSVCSRMEITEFPLSILDQISREDIEEYLDYITYYKKDGKEYSNNERGKKRKLSALKSFYNYYFCAEMIKTNPAALVPLPKQHEKEIIRLDADEVAILLDQVEEGDHLTKNQLKYHNKTKIRDIALLTLLLGTGIRVSECVGLDLEDYCRSLEAAGDIARAFFADIIGSAIAESTGALLYDEVVKLCGDMGMQMSNTYCPGNCGWDVMDQHALFKLLPPEPCGIELTESGLMVPVKSISGIIGAGREMKKSPSRCAICKRKNCHMRKYNSMVAARNRKNNQEDHEQQTVD